MVESHCARSPVCLIPFPLQVTFLFPVMLCAKGSLRILRPRCHLPVASQVRRSLCTPAVVAEIAPEIRSIQKSSPEHEITQESMLKPLENFTPIKDSFAVVYVSGHQVRQFFLSILLTFFVKFKVTAGDEIMVEKIASVEVLQRILLDKVLLVGTRYAMIPPFQASFNFFSREHTIVGAPLLNRAKVLAEVQEHSKTEKVIIFKKHHHKRKKRR